MSNGIEHKEIETEVSKADVFKAYKAKIQEKRADIEAFSWQDGSSEFEPKEQRPIAFFDINGDGIEEMFYMAVDGSEYQAELNIYTYEDGEAKNIEYSSSYVDFSTGRVMTDDALTNTPAAGGMNFAVYMSKDGKTLNMYSSSVDEFLSTYVEEYSVSGKKLINGTFLADNRDMTGQYGDMYNFSYEDGEEVSGERMQGLLRANFADIGTVIICSNMTGEDGGDDNTIWGQFSEDDALMMTIDDALAYADIQIG
ncbi:hypothetical protein HMPREF2826_08080 [Olsenella sp. HMSC062G07]|nr:hypothetical protein HMPREF2826_08080 [Olsenella sp. HMSC062G07]